MSVIVYSIKLYIIPGIRYIKTKTMRNIERDYVSEHSIKVNNKQD